MDTGWIQVFVLMLSECIAPEGKTVCQQHELELKFVDRADCELALVQLVSLKSKADDVIVDKDSARCVPSARQREVFPDLAGINAAHADTDGWQPPPIPETDRNSSVRKAHEERLANLASCDDTGGQGPCKVGDIIIEDADSRKIEVWRRER